MNSLAISKLGVFAVVFIVTGLSAASGVEGDFRIDVKVQSDFVEDDLNHFPYYYNLALIEDDDFWKKVDSEGGDLRITTDEEGENRIPLEVVYLNKNEEKGEIHFRSNTTENEEETYWIWFSEEGSNLVQPNPEDEFGSENVWKEEYKGVWHLHDAEDSTSYGNDLIERGGAEIGDIDGMIGKGTNLGSGESLEIPYSQELDLSAEEELSYQVIYRDDGSQDSSSIMSFSYYRNEDPSHRGVDLWVDSGSGDIAAHLIHDWRSNEAIKPGTEDSGSNPNILDGDWNQIHVTYSGGMDWTDARLYADGVNQNTVHQTSGTLTSSTSDIGFDGNPSRIGGRSDDNGDLVQEQRGDYEEVRLIDEKLSSEWIKTENNMQDSPDQFYATGNSSDTVSICDRRGPSQECISNSTHPVDGEEFTLENIFEAKETAVFQALDERASITVSNSTHISGLWQGSFNIESDGRTRLEAGAEFKPGTGIIKID